MYCKCCASKHKTHDELRACHDAVGRQIFVSFLADYYARTS